MKVIKNFLDFIFEKKKEKKKVARIYEYGCLMADIDVPAENKIKIPAEEIYDDEDHNFGIPDHPHVTLLFGLHKEVGNKEMKEFVKDITPIDDISITGISFFESKDYDVVKYDIESKTFHKINKDLRDTFEYTNDHPKYHPHLTIAYVKKGKAKQYEEKFEEPIELDSVTNLRFSTPAKKKYYYTLKEKEVN